VDPDMLYEICIDAGYSPEHSRYLAAALTFAAVGSYRRGVETVLTRCYSEGYIRREALIDELSKAYDITDRRALVLMRADWEYFADERADILRIYQESFRRGVIDEATFVHDLEDMDFDPLRVHRYLRREQIRKLGRRT